MFRYLVSNYLVFAVAFIVMWAYFNYLGYRNSKYAILHRISLLSICMFSIALFAYIFYTSIQPKEWDFTCFYMFGKVARYHLDFYNPDDYYKILPLAKLPFKISEGFEIELMNVGCLYPPPTVFLFLPLGYMSYQNAMYFMYFLILLATLASVYLCKLCFFKKDKLKGWLLAIILIFCLSPVWSTVRYTQTCIFLLLLIFLVYYKRNSPSAGIFLALSIFIKPFVIILLLYFILRKQWKTVLYFTVTCAVIGIISLLYFGMQPFLEYLFINPSKRLPAFWYSEITNQSLLSELYRFFPTDWDFSKKIYYIISSVMVIISSYMVYIMLKRKAYELIITILLALVLIIYPNGQVYYPIVHILSVLILIDYLQSNQLKILILGLFFLFLKGTMIFVNTYLFVFVLLLLYRPFWNKYVLRIENRSN